MLVLSLFACIVSFVTKGDGAWLYTTVLQCMDEECRKVNVKQECAVKIT